ncbi:MAG: HlyD family efflux transporter periplasmic adaptor subunit [Deltaproteobacteria bacterium]|nr:HlyD family efflux transporter periplasmic adaptor subunit [Deltaproteobacteria bacterium]
MFERTFKTIDSETDGRSVWLVVAASTLAFAWIGWLLFVPVSVYETSSSARVEVSSASYTVDAPVAGAVVATPGLTLGRVVSEGEVLVELDATALKLALAEATAREASLGPQLEAVKREAQAEAAGLTGETDHGVSSLAQAYSEDAEATMVARFAAAEAARLRRMHEAGVGSEADALKGKADADRASAVAAARRAAVAKLRSESSTRKSDRRIRIAVLERTEAVLRGELEVQRARSESLRNEIRMRQIRSPAAGTVSAIPTLRVGAVLKEGAKVATILAGDGLRIVAELPPAAVFGRVRPGQAARVRFQGFPWAEYGLPSATVTRVAGEAHESVARVELALDPRTSARIPVQHGQPAEVTIEVGRKTPWRLLLGAAGRAAETGHTP